MKSNVGREGSRVAVVWVDLVDGGYGLHGRTDGKRTWDKDNAIQKPGEGKAMSDRHCDVPGLS